MERKNSTLERVLVTVVILLFISRFFLESRQQKVLLMGTLLLIVALMAVSKAARFYKQANRVINTIRLISIMIMLASSSMYFFDWGRGFKGIIGWVMVAFIFTWQYSFLDNKPEIK